MQLAPRAKPSSVAARGRDAATVELQRREADAWVAGIGDGDAPGIVLRGLARKREVASEIGEPAEHLGPGESHRLERAGSRKALAYSAEVDGTASFEARAAGVLVDRDRRASPPAVGGSRGAVRQLGEGAVVARSDERLEDRGVEQAVGHLPRIHGGAQRSEEPRVDDGPLTEGAIEPRQVAARFEASQHALARLDLDEACSERALGLGLVLGRGGNGKLAARPHRRECAADEGHQGFPPTGGVLTLTAPRPETTICCCCGAEPEVCVVACAAGVSTTRREPFAVWITTTRPPCCETGVGTRVHAMTATNA